MSRLLGRNTQLDFPSLPQRTISIHLPQDQRGKKNQQGDEDKKSAHLGKK